MKIKEIETNRFLQGNLSGLKKSTKVLKNSSKQPLKNIFWYSPAVLMLRYDYWKEIDFDKVGFPYIPFLSNYGISLDLKILFTIYDEELNKIFSTKISNIDIQKSSTSNKLIAASMFDGDTYEGVCLNYPYLPEGNYTFEIREYWQWDTNYQPITRRLCFHANVGNAGEKNNISAIDRMNKSLNISTDFLFNADKKNKTEIGNQSLSLLSPNIPTLYLDTVNHIAFSDFYGSDTDLYEALTFLYSPVVSSMAMSQIDILKNKLTNRPAWPLLRNCLAANLQASATSSIRKINDPTVWNGVLAPINYKTPASFISYQYSKESVQRYVSPYNLITSAEYPETRLVWKKKIANQIKREFDIDVQFGTVTIPLMEAANESK